MAYVQPDRNRRRCRRAFTIIELLVTVSIIALLIGILLPAIGKSRDQAKLVISQGNLRNYGTAHAAYSAEHSDRQATNIDDNISTYGSSTYSAYTEFANQWGPVHPNIVLGWGPEEEAPGSPRVLWQYRLDGTYPGHHGWAGHPINWAASGSVRAWGHFRFLHQTRILSTYLDGRYYAPVAFAPKDKFLYEIVRDGFESPAEFASIPADDTTEGSVLYTSSYSLSPAAMYNPEVLKWDEEEQRAYKEPWDMPAGHKSPGMGQALYPDLKSHMLEHHWLQNTRVECNPAFFTSPGTFQNCEPYYFNHGWESVPVTLFYDGHVSNIGVRESEMADSRIMAQSGHGIWSRDTPLGANGYFINYGYDFSETSFHILTESGIRGRDKVGR